MEYLIIIGLFVAFIGLAFGLTVLICYVRMRVLYGLRTWKHNYGGMPVWTDGNAPTSLERFHDTEHLFTLMLSKLEKYLKDYDKIAALHKGKDGLIICMVDSLPVGVSGMVQHEWLIPYVKKQKLMLINVVAYAQQSWSASVMADLILHELKHFYVRELTGVGDPAHSHEIWRVDVS